MAHTFRRTIVHIEMTDGTQYLDVPITHADQIAYELTARKHKWGNLAETPQFALTFCAWHHLCAGGKVDREAGFDGWSQRVAEFDMGGDEDVDPTQPEATTDSPSSSGD